ncbi:hypothetical protein [Nitrosomonas ureae]|uniref:hypothetical protein n=1 Tax=Nitrosomonas ureae TaxID=44577 RepID=UPI0011B0EFDC|nr:hypothetical protein [Nitrosomonas ureae]
MRDDDGGGGTAFGWNLFLTADCTAAKGTETLSRNFVGVCGSVWGCGCLLLCCLSRSRPSPLALARA